MIQELKEPEDEERIICTTIPENSVLPEDSSSESSMKLGKGRQERGLPRAVSDLKSFHCFQSQRVKFMDLLLAHLQGLANHQFWFLIDDTINFVA